MLKINKLIVGIMLLSFCLFISKAVFSAEAEKIVDGMNQGEFAMLLIKKLGAEGNLPPAATIKDAFKFLEKIGVIPPQGWDAKATITKEIVAYTLGVSSEAAAKLTFDNLVGNLENKIADILWSMGIRSVEPQTVSPSGAGSG